MQDVRFGVARAWPGRPAPVPRARKHGPEETHDRSDGDGSDDGPITYRLCPVCQRAVPTTSRERYCVNDGARLLEVCPRCAAVITSPYARYCAGCGADLAGSPSPDTEERRP